MRARVGPKALQLCALYSCFASLLVTLEVLAIGPAPGYGVQTRGRLTSLIHRIHLNSPCVGKTNHGLFREDSMAPISLPNAGTGLARTPVQQSKAASP